jgi:hypothetical protein
MKRKLFVLFALIVTVASVVTAQQSGYAWPPVDVLVSLNGQTIGSAVSNTTAASGTLGTFSSYTSCPNNASTMYVGANIAPLGASLQVLGSSTIYPASTTWPAVYYNDSVTLQNCFVNVSSAPLKMNIAVLRAFGPPNAFPSGKDYDELRIDDNNDTGTVLYAVAQLQNGNCPASAYGESSQYYGLEIETRSGGAAITGFSGTSGTLTFTAANSLTASQSIYLFGFTGANAALNGQAVTVLSTGLSSTQFEAVVTGSNYLSATGFFTVSGDPVTHTNNCIYIHYPYSISATSETGTTATYTTSVANQFFIGEQLSVLGVGVTGYNGGIVVSGCDGQTTNGYVCTSTSFTATLTSSSLASSAGGIVTPIYIENLMVDGPNNLVSLGLFNSVPPYTQIGNTITSPFAGAPLPTSGWGISRTLFGNIEAGNDGGTGIFQYFMMQYTNPQFPLIPQLWSGVLSPQRAADWTQAGVVGVPKGTIPSASYTLCQSLGTAGQSSTYAQSVTATQINTALSTCASTPKSYVYLNPGTYANLGGITFPGGASYLVLGGAGANQTLLQFTSNIACGGIDSHICLPGGDSNSSGSPANLTTWIPGTPPGPVGYAQGSAFINLTAVTGTGHDNLYVGNPAIADQCDSGLSGDPCTGTVTDDGSFFVTTSTTTGNASGTGLTGPYSVSGNPGNAERTNRSQQQVFTIVECDGITTIGHKCSSGTNIGISPGLYASDWNIGQTPEVWWSSSPASYIGLENLSEDSTGDSQAFPGVNGVDLFNCSNCWVYGVRSIETGYAHFQVWWGDHITLSSNYAYLTKYWTTQG